MPYISDDLIREIALTYMNTNANKGDSPEHLYGLYAEAEAKLKDIRQKNSDEHMKNFSL